MCPKTVFGFHFFAHKGEKMYSLNSSGKIVIGQKDDPLNETLIWKLQCAL